MSSNFNARLCILAFGVIALASCSSDPELSPRDQALLDVKAYVDGELTALHQAALDLQSAAPAPDADGWNATDDSVAVEQMRTRWRTARVHYERVEGAIAVLFPALDRSTDERYDGFIELAADNDLFDGEGATGVHAIERILWADSHPPAVVAFESGLGAYVPAAFPADEAEATRFRDGLLERLVTDTRRMRDDFEPLALDPAAAFRGVIGSMEEQLEKVTLAATGEDESRYAQFTLTDMRANLEGGRTIYLAFERWLVAEGGVAEHQQIVAGFEEIETAYDRTSGDAIPTVPDGWNPDAPTADHLATDYGMLFTLLTSESDPEASDSLVSIMTVAAERLGIPTLP